jgi:Flp pilus assembly protein TadG
MLKSVIRKFLRDRSGNIGIVLAISAIPLLGAASFGVDTFRQHDAQARLQAALDAGALAGASTVNANEQTIRTVIQDFARANGIDELIDPATSLDIKFNTNGSIRVSAKGEIPTTLGSLLGVDSLSVHASTEVMAGRTGAEVALVLDTTGSMNSDGKIQALRTAASDFVKTIDNTNANTADGMIRISLVPYAQYVNVDTANKGASWMDPVNESAGNVWNGCVGSREYPNNIIDGSYGDGIPPIMNETCAQPIEPLTADTAKLLGHIAGLNGSGLTYIPGGLAWGWRTLSAMPPFSEGTSATEAEQNNIRKYIVLMTDGDNTVRKQPGNPEHVKVGNASQAADKLTLELCDRIKDQDITIFSIAFKVSNGNTRNMLSNCASSSENYYDADDPAQLSAAFNAIGAKVTAVRLSK